MKAEVPSTQIPFPKRIGKRLKKLSLIGLAKSD